MTTSPAPTTLTPCESKVLLVGDSTMLAIRRYGALGALHGFNVTYDAAPGRTGPHRAAPGRIDLRSLDP